MKLRLPSNAKEMFKRNLSKSVPLEPGNDSEELVRTEATKPFHAPCIEKKLKRPNEPTAKPAIIATYSLKKDRLR